MTYRFLASLGALHWHNLPRDNLVAGSRSLGPVQPVNIQVRSSDQGSYSTLLLVWYRHQNLEWTVNYERMVISDHL
jgi:hypothetical protein